MDTLPPELVDGVIQQLAEFEFPYSARFPVLSDESRQAVTSTRLVARGFRDSKKLKDLFISVLEETPFMWHRDQMPRLIALSRSKMANQLQTLTLCGINSDPWHRDADSGLQSDQWEIRIIPKYLTNVLRRFMCVKHLRYYPTSPKCFREAWPGRKSRADIGPVAQWGYPPDDELIHSWFFHQQEPTWIFNNTMSNVVDAGLSLESVMFPLFGNRASYCGLQISAAYFPSALKRLTISLTDRFNDNALFEPWLANLRNLTFLEVAISRNPNSLGPWNSFANCRRLTSAGLPTPRDELPRLKDFRLMADNQICFSERGLLEGLNLFPNLQRLGFAHVLIKSELNNAVSWESFVKQLVPLGLEQLWLLDPRNLWTDGYMGQAGHYRMVKYRPDDSFRTVANEVRLIDTNSMWGEDLVPPKRRDFDYPGFAIFEEACPGRPL